MDNSNIGLRKRQQISNANKTMFLAIAGVSVVIGVCIVFIVILGQKILFGEKVIAEKTKTEHTLQQNLDSVDALKSNIRVLSTNESLQSVKLKNTDSALQVILDALPADANSTALASSLQLKLLNNIQDVVIDSLKVDPVSGVEISSDNTTVADSSDPNSNSIRFTFTVSTNSNNAEGLKQVLKNIEKSIRPINITNLSIEGQGSRIVMTAVGVGYYSPAQTVHLMDKVVKQ